MTIAKLALRNFLGAGMKAWLRVVVLSLAFVVIIGLQGLYVGMGEQMSQAMISAFVRLYSCSVERLPVFGRAMLRSHCRAIR